MTYGAWTPDDFGPIDYGVRARKPVSPALLCAIAIVGSAALGLPLLYAQGRAPEIIVATAPLPAAPAVEPHHAPAAIAPLRRYAAFLDPAYASAHALTFAESAPLRAGFQPRRPHAGPEGAPAFDPPSDATDLKTAALDPAPVEAPVADDTEAQVVPEVADVPAVVRDIPLPMPRPSFAMPDRPTAAGRRQVATVETSPAPAPTAPGAPSFFQRLFGDAGRPAGPALAYAAPEQSAVINVPNVIAGRQTAFDRQTAVYDITAHTVYLPDGTQLEAHSGLGPARDNPASVAQHMRGVTPPNLYELTPREALFHGVRALRLNPVGGTTYGRAGLLTHSYMLRGRSGESNGCVVFRNYDAFIAAYDRGMFRRLAVVASLSGA